MWTIINDNFQHKIQIAKKKKDDIKSTKFMKRISNCCPGSAIGGEVVKIHGLFNINSPPPAPPSSLPPSSSSSDPLPPLALLSYVSELPEDLIFGHVQICSLYS